MKHFLLIAFGLAVALYCNGQQPGDYTLTISTSDPLLNGDDLDIYFHVPSTYNPSVPSKMILGFHGLGNPNNSDQIRNYLSPLGDGLNAVVVCPNPYLQDQPRSEIVLNLAYDSVLTWFNIDTNHIYLTGYSAGSDVAAQYFFGEPNHRMKGLIWHSPGFFFNPDLSNPQDIPPVCLCSGTVDFTSIIQTNLLNGDLEGAGFPYLYNSIPGVDHTMEYPTFTDEMLECINFIDANSPNVGIQEWRGKQVFIYPNPVNENETLTVSGIEGRVLFSIYNSLGQTVWTNQFDNVSDQLRIEGLSEKVNNGVYWLTIDSDLGRLSKLIVVK